MPIVNPGRASLCHEWLADLSRLSEHLGAGTRSHHFYGPKGGRCSRKLNHARGNTAREEQSVDIHWALSGARTRERNLLPVRSHRGCSACLPRLELIPPISKAPTGFPSPASPYSAPRACNSTHLHPQHPIPPHSLQPRSSVYALPKCHAPPQSLPILRDQSRKLPPLENPSWSC